MDDYDTEEFYEYPDNIRENVGPPMMNDGNNHRNRYKTAYGPYCGGYGKMERGRGGFGPPDYYHGHRDNYGPPFGPPPGPWSYGPRMCTRGSPYPSRAQKNEAVKYLIKCGVPREHLKNLSKDLMQLINPDYCGLCAVEFDTFSLARLHYTSKNHIKNQKKWQNNTSHGGGYAVGPLKSRDLYCELCDVEITSKVHSESHYAGKSHRAIVDGRRNPRNPILLQPGMEDRVKQLVRREKRCLISDAADLESVAGDADKAVPPELQCEICKTFVTCSEQMTLHLNGKKHLTKEKQHILKMMKGDTTVNDKKPKVAELNDDDLLRTLDQELGRLPPIEDYDEIKDEKALDTSVDDVADDWENSGEQWDEPETRVQ